MVVLRRRTPRVQRPLAASVCLVGTRDRCPDEMRGQTIPTPLHASAKNVREPTRPGRPLTLLLSGLLLLMGVAFVWAVQARSPAAPAHAGANAAEPQGAASAVAQRVSEGGGRAHSPASRIDDRPRLEIPAPQAATTAEMTAEENRAFHFARHQKAIEDHGREPVDPAWARATAKTIDTELKGLATAAGFTATDADCRS